MNGPTPTAPILPRSGESGIETATRTVGRFAAFVIGGTIALAVGVQLFTNSIGPIINCEVGGCNPEFGPANQSNAIYLAYVPGLAGGTLLIILAIVFFLFAYRAR
jgi:hypothetical protein